MQALHPSPWQSGHAGIVSWDTFIAGFELSAFPGPRTLCSVESTLNSSENWRVDGKNFMVLSLSADARGGSSPTIKQDHDEWMHDL